VTTVDSGALHREDRDVRLRHLSTISLSVAVAATWLVVVQPGLSAPPSVNGRWHGRLVYPQEAGNIPTSAYPAAKLTVTAGSVVAEFQGKTGAAHDADNAISTCRITYRHRADSAGWRIYVQAGKSVVTGATSGGPPDLAPCGGMRGGATRLRRAGARLLVEAVTDYRVEDGFGPGKLRGFLGR
jgi:hypothetical protein